MNNLLRTVCIALLSCQGAVASQAQTATATFDVQITIQSDCAITSTNNLDFGTQGVLDANVDATTTLQVQCTSGTPYDVGLDAGLASGATVTTRQMTSGANTIDYELFSDSTRTTNWGETVSTDTVTETGTGSAQTFTVYGRVPVQSTPAAGTYTDTIGITVTF